VLSRKLVKKQPGRRYLTALAAAGLLGGVLLGSGIVNATTPAGLFELDGNATTENTQPGSDDWDRVCHEVTGSDCSTSSDTTTATAVAWTPDTHGVITGPPALAACATNNCTIFTGGGSKDPIDVNQWAWKDNVGGLPDKDNLQHGFAARYSVPSSSSCPATNPNGTPNTDGTLTCEMLFFGNDRFDNSGDAQQGFWFFQNKIGLASNAVGGGNGFSGVHKKGDLLLISDFSNGGAVSTVTVYTWDPDCTKTDIPKSGPVSGQSCGDANLRFQASSTTANCAPASGAGIDPAISGFCGTVNNGDGVAAPWSFTDKSGNNTYLGNEFYEGGVNLSKLGLGGECFASIASETRSSQSTTAVLKDFVLGGFGNCESSISTSAAGVGGDGTIGSGTVSSGKDTATVHVTGISVWTGTVNFYLCGPDANLTTCSTSSGVHVGSGVTVNNATNGTSASTAKTVDSGTATLSSVGHYCWSATFTSGTNGVNDQTEDGTGECFDVNPVTPTLVTQASCDLSPCTLGTATISDTATLSGAATQPGSAGPSTAYPTINPTVAGAGAGGTITWVLYGPTNGGCTDTKTLSTSSAAVSGNATYGPVSYKPVAADGVGTYTWVANYGGDGGNTSAAATNTCASPGANETVVLSGTTSSSSAQRWLPNDRIVLTASGGLTLDGTLTVKLYYGTFTVGTDGVCTADTGAVVKYTEPNIDTSPGGVPSASGTAFNTTNSTFFVGTKSDGSAGGLNGTYFWLIHYDDANLADPKDRCESTSITVTD
jgi:hypothetical protein